MSTTATAQTTTATTAPRAPLSPHEQSELLRIARVCLKEWMRSGRLPPGRPHRGSLLEPSMAHVRLHLSAAIARDAMRERSSLDPSLPLYRAVAGAAIDAATDEPRLTPEEVTRARIAVAVLSPLTRITAPSEIEIGVHGLALVCDGRTRLALPDRALTSGLDGERLAAALAGEAGLDAGSWQGRDVALYAFTAQTFADPE